MTFGLITDRSTQGRRYKTGSRWHPVPDRNGLTPCGFNAAAFPPEAFGDSAGWVACPVCVAAADAPPEPSLFDSPPAPGDDRAVVPDRADTLAGVREDVRELLDRVIAGRAKQAETIATLRAVLDRIDHATKEPSPPPFPIAPPTDDEVLAWIAARAGRDAHQDDPRFGYEPDPAPVEPSPFVPPSRAPDPATADLEARADALGLNWRNPGDRQPIRYQAPDAGPSPADVKRMRPAHRRCRECPHALAAHTVAGCVLCRCGLGHEQNL